jgi:hypothetical protein
MWAGDGRGHVKRISVETIMRILLLESIHEDAQSMLEAAATPVRATALDAATVAQEAQGCSAIITRGGG